MSRLYRRILAALQPLPPQRPVNSPNRQAAISSSPTAHSPINPLQPPGDMRPAPMPRAKCSPSPPTDEQARPSLAGNDRGKLAPIIGAHGPSGDNVLLPLDLTRAPNTTLLVRRNSKAIKVETEAELVLVNASGYLEHQQSAFIMNDSKNVAFAGPLVADTLVHHLRTGEYVVQQGSIHPEVEEGVKIGPILVRALVAPGNEGSRKLFQQTIVEDSSSYHSIVYLTNTEFLTSHKGELEALLAGTGNVPFLILVIDEDGSPSEEALCTELNLKDDQERRIKLVVSSLPLAASGTGFKWLSERLL
ncbi:hypothetical protein NMY22_g12116 [Coprinellus aureogranulatus]|nr:hypothetical protein NMY22_g12116 [Coprinellus aureogranulatus]